MKTFVIISIIVFTTQLLFGIENKGLLGHDSPKEFLWDNGKIKETADWDNGVIIGFRKLYNEEGRLIEEHHFKKYQENSIDKGKGVITSFYPSGNVASVVPVLQEIYSGKYTIRIEGEVVGYHDTPDKTIAYKFNLTIPFFINKRSFDYYSEFNVFFNDVLLLYPERHFQGLNTKVTYLHSNGTTASIGSIQNGHKNKHWKFYFDNEKIESEGNYYEQLKFFEKVGSWKYYNKEGNLLKEEEYSKKKVNDFINIGSLINVGKYYTNGNLSYAIQYPELDDIVSKIDTIEKYLNNQTPLFKYNKEDKCLIFNPILNSNNEYKYSGKFEEFYNNGNIKMIGYLGKSYTKNIENKEDIEEMCLLTEKKKIGTWYFFNEEGVMTNIVKYDLCGTALNDQITPKDLKTQIKKYGNNKSKYNYNFIIAL